MVTKENLKEAIMRVCGIAIVRNKVELSLDELKQIVEIMPQVTGDFPICSICRDDLAGKGYDVEKIDDSNMERLDSKLGDDYCEQLFWGSMEIIADGMELPKEGKEEEDD